METNIKEQLLEQICILKKAVETDDIEKLVHSIDSMKFDTRYSTGVIVYLTELIIKFISEHISRNGLDTLRVKRKGEYNTETYDTYQMCKGELYRNGHNAKWDSVGKLYQAYKYIKKR